MQRTYEEKLAAAVDYLNKINFNWLRLNVPSNRVDEMEGILTKHSKQDFIAGLEFAEENPKKMEKFTLANDLDFYNACADFIDGKKALQRNPLQNVGDRARLLEELEKHGFTVIKTKKPE